MSSNPILSLAALEEFDREAPCSGTDWRFCCPFCGDGKPKDSAHRSLCLLADAGAWICHRCGAKGKLGEQIEGKPCRFPAAAPAAEPQRLKIPDLVPLARTAGAAYLQGRGIDAADAHAAGVRYAPRWEHWRKDGAAWTLLGTSRRVVFPVRDARGTLTAIQGRAIDDDEPGPRMISRGRVSQGVFATPGALDRDPVTLVEAPIDALSLHVSGLPAVALLGKDNLPQWFMTALAHRHVFLGLDADAAGDAAAVRLAAVLRGRKSVVERLRPFGAKDWNLMLTGAPGFLQQCLNAVLVDAG